MRKRSAVGAPGLETEAAYWKRVDLSLDAARMEIGDAVPSTPASSPLAIAGPSSAVSSTAPARGATAGDAPVATFAAGVDSACTASPVAAPAQEAAGGEIEAFLQLARGTASPQPALRSATVAAPLAAPAQGPAATALPASGLAAPARPAVAASAEVQPPARPRPLTLDERQVQATLRELEALGGVLQGRQAEILRCTSPQSDDSDSDRDCEDARPNWASFGGVAI